MASQSAHGGLQEPDTKIELRFHSARVGSLQVDHSGVQAVAAVTLHDVPTQIETYKSHNHVHMIKNGDIGQALVLHALAHLSEEGQQEYFEQMLCSLTDMEKNGELPEMIQSGLTPPMIKPCAPLFPCSGLSDPDQV